MRRLLLITSIILLVLLFLIIIFPYLGYYIQYLRSSKSVDEKGFISYSGELNVFALRRDDSGAVIYDVDRTYRYNATLNFTSSNVVVGLKVWNISVNGEESLMYSQSLILDRNSNTIRFLVPDDDVQDLDGYKLIICPNPGRIHFGSLLGTPSQVGVPRIYLAAFIDSTNNVVITDNWWETWDCGGYIGRYDVGTFNQYVRLEGSYMLLSYALYIGEGEVENDTLKSLFYDVDPPIYRYIFKELGIEGVVSTVNRVRNDGNLTLAIYRETISLIDSNIFPIDQEWLQALISYYIALTPISEVLTVAPIILLYLYLRGGR